MLNRRKNNTSFRAMVRGNRRKSVTGSIQNRATTRSANVSARNKAVQANKGLRKAAVQTARGAVEDRVRARRGAQDSIQASRAANRTERKTAVQGAVRGRAMERARRAQIRNKTISNMPKPRRIQPVGAEKLGRVKASKKQRWDKGPVAVIKTKPTLMGPGGVRERSMGKVPIASRKSNPTGRVMGEGTKTRRFGEGMTAKRKTNPRLKAKTKSGIGLWKSGRNRPKNDKRRTGWM